MNAKWMTKIVGGVEKEFQRRRRDEKCGVWKVFLFYFIFWEHKINLAGKNFPRMNDNQINARDSANVAVLLTPSLGAFPLGDRVGVEKRINKIIIPLEDCEHCSTSSIKYFRRTKWA